MTTDPTGNIFALRMRLRRGELGLSQKQLGIAAGIDEGVASTRINRYEVGVHSPDFLTARNIAQALGVPLAYFYAEDDQLAALIERFGRANKKQRQTMLAAAQRLD